jgi:hypothetical protein
MRFARFVIAFVFMSAIVTGAAIFFTTFLLMGEKLANVYPQGRLEAIFCSVTFYVRNLYDPALWTVFSRLSGDGVGPAFRSRREAVIEAMRRFRKYAERCDLAPLRGKDLACWCPLDQPCHADVLLELVNKGDE